MSKEQRFPGESLLSKRIFSTHGELNATCYFSLPNLQVTSVAKNSKDILYIYPFFNL